LISIFSQFLRIREELFLQGGCGMWNSTRSYFNHSRLTPAPGGNTDSKLLPCYQAIIDGKKLVSITQHQKLRLLGKGGQGMVFCSERQGSDAFKLHIALKIFSPHPYSDDDRYCEDMGRIADIASRVALIQHDNLVGIQNFVNQDGIRLMEMECIDGFDLCELLSRRMLQATKARAVPAGWEYINRVIVTEGPVQARLKPGMAIQVLRDCLAGLGALHREGIVHGDLKPSNIMLKRTGNIKIIDLGSAVNLGSSAARPMWSPAYVASEVLEGGPNSPQADLASMGYILVEMLAGQSPFEGLNTFHDLLAAKKALYRKLPELLPEEVRTNELLLHLCRRLVSSDPSQRFPSAQTADQDRKGAADFHRQLVKGDLSSNYETDFRFWLEQVNRTDE
jgi:eukaryotic-like serine/threonine-protein kinase